MSPFTSSVESGEDVPIPSRPPILSQKKFELFSDTRPPVVINGIDPIVRPDRYRFPEVVRLLVDANVAVKLVVEARVKYPLVAVIPVVEAKAALRFVVEARVKYPLVAVNPVVDANVAVKLVVEARVKYPLVAVNPVDDALARVV